MITLDKYKRNLTAASDEEFLITQIWNLKHIFFNELAAIKNTQLEYLAFSENFAESFKFNHMMLGKKLPTENKADQEIVLTELEIINSKLPNDSIYQFKHQAGVQTYIMRKRPLINLQTGNCVGILILGGKLDPTTRRRMIRKYFMGKNIEQSIILPTKDLTQQEQDIIACLLLGFQHRKEIALILNEANTENYSERQIKHRLEDLYKKFNCTSLNELMDIVVNTHKDQVSLFDISTAKI